MFVFITAYYNLLLSVVMDFIRNFPVGTRYPLNIQFSSRLDVSH